MRLHRNMWFLLCDLEGKNGVQLFQGIIKNI